MGRPPRRSSRPITPRALQRRMAVWMAYSYLVASAWMSVPGHVRLGMQMMFHDIAHTIRRIRPPRR